MAVAELFIGAFITVLFEKLASGDLIRLARSAGIYSELNKWRNTLTQIQAVLTDAGQKHIRDRSVQLWLNKLQHLAYEIDDVLDDLATEVMRCQLNQESDASTSKVIKFIPTKFHALKYGRKMSSKLDGITSKLHDLVEEKNILGLNDTVERPHRSSRRLEETSLVDESKIVGREGDKEALIGMLLDNESSTSQNVNVVTIVGMGGIGKTTIAQLLYNDKRVKDHFALMSWVCVSDDFDLFRISKAIFKDVGGDDIKFETLNQLQVALTEKLSKKRFLFVLDDVWNEIYNEWELLQRPFTVGAPGSKILVTTRKIMVASVMDSVQSYPLKLFSDEEGLSLFAQHASGKQNFNVNRILKLHGEDIVKKCGRLPLALKTLGRVFRTKFNVEEWEELLSSEIWDLDNGSEILPALMLSYYDLSPHLKQMFVYCCLFPKDYMFDKDELVLLWMAEGFVYESNRNKSMENFGRECFQELVLRSFFQHSTNDKSRYIMHDLIHDLATSVADEFFLMLDDKMDVCDKHGALEKIHHLSFVHDEYRPYDKYKGLQRARHLRTFLAALSVAVYTTRKKVPEVLVPQQKFLRVLSIAKCSINEVPQSIGSLKHLRYLNCSCTGITCLPEQVGDLHNLQSLLLSHCHELSTLPNSIIKLTNLRHLDISHTIKLKRMPLGIGGLTGLQTLSRVIIGGSGKFRISQLKGFLHLHGQLSIEGLHKVKNAVSAKEVNLQQKKGICDLRLEWSDVFDGSRNEITEYEVLEELRPFEKLRSLRIFYYNGTKFPSWVQHPSFVCLTLLTLRDCRNCTCLPMLGHLPLLQKLFVGGMYGLKSLGSEFLGPSNSCHGVAFPSLEVLVFKNMKGWEEWSTSGSDKAEMFPCLREISIINCPKLDVVAIGSIPSLWRLDVDQCSSAVLRSLVSVSSAIAILIMENIKGLTPLCGEVLERLRAVEYLSISKCEEFTYLWESDAQTCKILGSLRKLEVDLCANLVSFGEKEAQLETNMKSVTEVRISNCPRLKSYSYPNTVEKLDISYCGSAIETLPFTLKNLTIGSLCISYMSNMKLFPQGCLIHITKLEVVSCANIESIPDNGYDFLPFLCLKELRIIDCKNLKSFPHEHFQNLTSLEHMNISCCPSLDDSFPCGLWPPNLNYLTIGGLKKPISEWGVQNFPTSLVTLHLKGQDSGVVSFAKAEDHMSGSSSFLLPSSLTCLILNGFMELESVLEGLEHLTCLQHLHILFCKKLRDLPETLLSSLLTLRVIDPCPKLRKKCRSRKGKYWPLICQIPNLHLVY